MSSPSDSMIALSGNSSRSQSPSSYHTPSGVLQCTIYDNEENLEMRLNKVNLDDSGLSSQNKSNQNSISPSSSGSQISPTVYGIPYINRYKKCELNPQINFRAIAHPNDSLLRSVVDSAFFPQHDVGSSSESSTVVPSQNNSILCSPASTVIDTFANGHLPPIEPQYPNYPVKSCDDLCPCDNRTMVRFRCIQCRESMCGDCKSAHERVSVTKEHEIINIENLLIRTQTLSQLVGDGDYGSTRPSTCNENSLDALDGVPCQVHDGQWALNYCMQCKAPLCRLCFSNHYGHRTTTLKESCEEIREEVRFLEREAKSRVQSIDSSLVRIYVVEQNNHESIDQVTREVVQHFDEVSMVLNRRRNSLINTANEIGREKFRVLQRQTHTLQQSRNLLNEAISKVSPNLETLEYSDLVKISRDLHSILKQMLPIHHALQPHVTDYIDFNKIAWTEFDQMMSGVKFCTHASADLTEVCGHGIETAMYNSDAHFKILTKSMQGLPMQVGGEIFQISLETGPAPHQAYKLQATDCKDGTYIVKYRIDIVGEIKIAIRLNGRHIRGSPFTVMVNNKPIYTRIGKPHLSLRRGSQNLCLSKPWGVYVDPLGNTIIADRGNNQIRILNNKGVLQHSFGEQGDAPGQLHRPSAVLVDSNGALVVVDKDNHRIQRFTLQGEFLSTHGHRGYGSGEFQYPWGIAQDPKTGNFAVSDSRNARVQIFTKDFEFIESYGYAKDRNHSGHHGKRNRLLDSPRGVCYGPNGVLYVTDFALHSIFGFHDSRNYMEISSPGSADGELSRPQGIVCDREGNLLVCDSKNHRIQVFSYNGTYLGKFGTREMTGFDIEKPCDIALGPDGSVVVVDLQHESVHFF